LPFPTDDFFARQHEAYRGLFHVNYQPPQPKRSSASSQTSERSEEHRERHAPLPQKSHLFYRPPPGGPGWEPGSRFGLDPGAKAEIIRMQHKERNRATMLQSKAKIAAEADKDAMIRREFELSLSSRARKEFNRDRTQILKVVEHLKREAEKELDEGGKGARIKRRDEILDESRRIFESEVNAWVEGFSTAQRVSRGIDVIAEGRIQANELQKEMDRKAAEVSLAFHTQRLSDK